MFLKLFEIDIITIDYVSEYRHRIYLFRIIIEI